MTEFTQEQIDSGVYLNLAIRGQDVVHKIIDNLSEQAKTALMGGEPPTLATFLNYVTRLIEAGGLYLDINRLLIDRLHVLLDKLPEGDYEAFKEAAGKEPEMERLGFLLMEGYEARTSRINKEMAEKEPMFGELARMLGVKIDD